MLGKKGRVVASAGDLESGGGRSNEYATGSGSINMNIASTNLSSRRRSRGDRGAVDGACGACVDYFAQPIDYLLDSVWFDGHTDLREYLSKHGNALWVSILVLIWYTSAIFAITTSKVIMLTLKFPYTLCTAQFTIATCVTLLYNCIYPKRKVQRERGGSLSSGDSPEFDGTTTGSITSDSGNDNEDNEKYGQKKEKHRGTLASVLFWCTDKMNPYILYQISISYTCGFLFTNMAFSVVTTSFAETVKSSEPITSVILAYLVLWEVESLPTYMCLLPICIGVSVSCLHDDSFNTFGFACAFVSNFCFSMRAVYAKRLMQKTKGAIDEVTLFGWVSLIGLCLLVPIAAYMEGKAVYEKFWVTWDSSYVGTRTSLLWILLGNGMAYSCYNIMSFLVLTRTSMVTHAVLNCVRRVFVIIFTSIFFDLHVTATNLVGVGMAVAGVIAFAYFKSVNPQNRNKSVKSHSPHPSSP